MILLIDNYDSFTFNIFQILVNKKHTVQVKRNDEITLKQIITLAPERIIISPGPGRPENSKISLDIVKKLDKSIPVLGICLGHQIIGVWQGMKLKRALEPTHGKTVSISHNGDDMFAGIPISSEMMLYNSLILDSSYIPESITVTATSSNGEIMALKHNQFPYFGVQFHPESILSKFGTKIIDNFLCSK